MCERAGACRTWSVCVDRQAKAMQAAGSAGDVGVETGMECVCVCVNT